MFINKDFNQYKISKEISLLNLNYNYIIFVNYSITGR